MGSLPVSEIERQKIRELRKTGHSLLEIKSIVNRGYGTIYRYIKDVPILPQYKKLWEIKRGGSRKKSEKDWEEARSKALILAKDFILKEKMIILSCLYWGEGNKKELNIINSDPSLLRVFINCLREIGINDDRITISLRLFEDLDKKKAVDYWLKTLNLPKNNITRFEIIKGKKTGKLKYGMCRVRVEKGGQYFKLIMSMIDLIRVGV